MCCSVLQCYVCAFVLHIHTCCSVLQCAAVCCSMIQCVVEWYSVWQCIVAYSSVFQCVAALHMCICVACKYMHTRSSFVCARVVMHYYSTFQDVPTHTHTHTQTCTHTHTHTHTYTHKHAHKYAHTPFRELVSLLWGGCD